MRVVIVGAGEVGVHVARLLSEEDHDVVVIDQDAARVGKITEQLDALVLHGNGASPKLGGGRVGLRVAEALEETDISFKIIESNADRVEYVASKLERGKVLHQRDVTRDFLVQEGIEHTDAFIAVTGDDRTNLLASMYAKQLGARETIAGVGRGEFIPLAESLGADITISGRLLAASAISQFVRQGDVIAVTLLESGAQMIELGVPEDSRVTGQSLADLKFPKETIVGMVLRDGETIIPRGNDTLEAGDDAVVFTTDAAVEKVESFFAPS